MADKEEILVLIKALAGRLGVSPSLRSFRDETGVKDHEWLGKYWTKWNDAIEEAGLTGKEFVVVRLDRDEVLARYVELVSELGKIPTQAELMMKHNVDKSFPSAKRLLDKIGRGLDGTKAGLELAKQRGEAPEVLEIFWTEVARLSSRRGPVADNETSEMQGYVYLLKAGKDYKIGRTNDVFRRHGELKVQLPEKGEPIHYFQTDDPSGIEAYWHNRFKDKRKNGEWFALDAADIKAFKRRKTFM